MEGHLVMSEKERRRKSVFDRVGEGQMTVREAAEVLGLSYRQCRRSYKRFRQEGDGGLVHRSRGRPSNRRLAEQVRRRAVRRYRQRYKGFGPISAAEKLAEEGLRIDHETLRRLLMAEGLWTKGRRRVHHRQRRERKAHFGELVQVDGSHHRWFGPQRPPACLLNMVDDATGHTLSLMDGAETTEGTMRLLWRWVERYGAPKALYTDRKNIFVTSREPTLEEQLAGQEPLTAFGQACAKLGIAIITAHSPQAKGRVERKHGVFQDRWVKELALKRIATVATANTLLENGFVDALNKKFARPPADPADYHRPVPKDIHLEDVFCFEETRVVQNDWTVQFNNRHYQILEENRPLPRRRDKVLVRLRLDHSLHILYKGRPLAFRPIATGELRRRLAQQAPAATAEPKPRSRPKPTKSPWRQNCIYMFAETGKSQHE
jgi:transposase